MALKSSFSSPAIRHWSLMFEICMLLMVFPAASVASSTAHPILSDGTFFSRSRRRHRASMTENGRGCASPVTLKHHRMTTGSGKACSIYVWDFTSALLSRWCNHLQRDCVYEGMGGKKFVRIEPGSMLQLLYPCSRYSTDRCWLCGGNFRDHLTLWWSKHLYTPFDLYVDQVYRDGVANGSSSTTASQKKQQQQPQSQNQLEYAFHRRYVVDLNYLLRGVQRDSEKNKVIQRQVSQRFPLVRENHGRIEIRNQGRIEVRNSVPYRSIGDDNNNNQREPSSTKATRVSSYAVPAVDLQRLGTTRRAIAILTVRELFLNALESLLDLEELDHVRLQQRQQQH